MSRKEIEPTEHDGPVLLERSEDQARKNLDAIALLDEWMCDESGYDEEVWPTVKRLIEENHPGPRRVFGE